MTKEEFKEQAIKLAQDFMLLLYEEHDANGGRFDEQSMWSETPNTWGNIECSIQNGKPLYIQIDIGSELSKEYVKLKLRPAFRNDGTFFFTMEDNSHEEN